MLQHTLLCQLRAFKLTVLRIVCWSLLSPLLRSSGCPASLHLSSRKSVCQPCALRAGARAARGNQHPDPGQRGRRRDGGDAGDRAQRAPAQARVADAAAGAPVPWRLLSHVSCRGELRSSNPSSVSNRLPLCHSAAWCFNMNSCKMPVHLRASAYSLCELQYVLKVAL